MGRDGIIIEFLSPIFESGGEGGIFRVRLIKNGGDNGQINMVFDQAHHIQQFVYLFAMRSADAEVNQIESEPLRQGQEFFEIIEAVYRHLAVLQYP